MDTLVSHFKHFLMTPLGSNTLLTGCIVMASVDADGLLIYTIRAILGGLIWLGFKLTADHIQQKRNRKKDA